MANPLPLVAPRNFILRIKVHCSKCENKTKLFLLTIPGLHSAIIDRKQGTVTISGTVKPSRIITLLEKGIGLKAELLWDQTPTSSSSSPTDAKDLQIVPGRSRIVAENNDLQRFVDSNDQMMSQLKQISRIQGLESIELKLNFRQENPTVKDKNGVEVVVHHGGGSGNNGGGGELCGYHHHAHGYPAFTGCAMHGNMPWPPYACGCVPQPGTPPPWGGGYSPSAPPNYDDAPPPPPAPAMDGSFFNQFSDENTNSCIVM